MCAVCIGAGVVADISEPKERGTFFGFMGIGPMVSFVYTAFDTMDACVFIVTHSHRSDHVWVQVCARAVKWLIKCSTELVVQSSVELSQKGLGGGKLAHAGRHGSCH